MTTVGDNNDSNSKVPTALFSAIARECDANIDDDDGIADSEEVNFV